MVMVSGNVWVNINEGNLSIFSVLKGNKVALTILPYFL